LNLVFNFLHIFIENIWFDSLDLFEIIYIF
jgi:hypothetical protein